MARTFWTNHGSKALRLAQEKAEATYLEDGALHFYANQGTTSALANLRDLYPTREDEFYAGIGSELLTILTEES